MSILAQWLDNTFYGFDHAILAFYHSLAAPVGAVLTPFAKLITLIGEKGLVFLVAALVLMLFRKTRAAGICMFGAICCGALITNICLKDVVARVRPMEAAQDIQQWWIAVGSPFEDGFSFPSGHVTAAAAAMMALILSLGKKYIAPGMAVVALMAASRNYLMAHYPTDVIAAMVVGAVAALIAHLITLILFALLEKYKKNKFCKFLLCFDICAAFQRKDG